MPGIKSQVLIIIIVGSLSLECGGLAPLWPFLISKPPVQSYDPPATAGGTDLIASAQEPTQKPAIEKINDAVKDKTTVRLTPFKISGEKAQYISLHMSPSFNYSGMTAVRPAIIDFELQTVVRGRLRTDLYVLFIIDGEKVFMSSSRWAVKRPIPGRVWMGERLVFRMPYEILMKIVNAKQVEIKMDAVRFELGKVHLQAIRDFAAELK